VRMGVGDRVFGDSPAFVGVALIFALSYPGPPIESSGGGE